MKKSSRLSPLLLISVILLGLSFVFLVPPFQNPDEVKHLGGCLSWALPEQKSPEMIAFWDLHDDAMSGFKVDHAQSLGLPVWVNHVAFDAPTVASMPVGARDREQVLDLLAVLHGVALGKFGLVLGQ